MFAIVALGPNDIEIPCVFFDTKEECETLLTNKGCEFKPKWSQYHVPSNADDHTEDEKGDWIYPFWDTFFTHYYGGCGEVWAFEIHEIEVGKPLVCWNLD